MEFIFNESSGSLYWIVLFLIGVVTGIVGGMGGSPGLIITPFMMATGMPPALAIGTARLSAFGGWLLSIKKFNDAKKVHWTKLAVIIPLAMLAGTIGTLFVIQIEPEHVYRIVGLTLILICPLVLMQKDFGLEEKEHGRGRRYFGYGVYFLIMIYGGFFGGGANIMAVFAMVTFLGFRVLDAYATHMVAWLMMSIVSTAVFIFYGHVHYIYAAVLFVGMSIGGYAGAHIAIKKGNEWVKRVVCFFAFVVGVKLLFFH